MLLAHGDFTWIPHVLSIIDKRLIICKTSSKRVGCILFSIRLCLSIYSMIFFHIAFGSDTLIEGASVKVHIDHNIAFSRRGKHQHESEIMSIPY